MYWTSVCLKTKLASGRAPRWNTSPAPTSWASAEASSLSLLSATADSSSKAKSRPIAAPICATSRAAGPSRSSRARSDAWRVAGSASAAAHMAAPPRPAAGLDDRLGQLLGEQRHPVGPLDDLVEDVVRE